MTEPKSVRPISLYYGVIAVVVGLGMALNAVLDGPAVLYAVFGVIGGAAYFLTSVLYRRR